MNDRFLNRAEAGRALARAVQALHPAQPVVLALPRGGVPVAAEVARALHAPLDLLLVRKIGVPGQPELALAAVVDGEPPDLVVDDPVMRATGCGVADVQAQLPDALREIERRRALYLRGRTPLVLAGSTVIVVDDGIATGTTVRAALKALRKRWPRRVVLAVPVAPPEEAARLRGEVDEFVCLQEPAWFRAVGAHYEDFPQVRDDEVVAALAASAAEARENCS
jgi:putative phosphoribosyl transferase